MGVVRVLLALAVVFGHAPGWGAINPSYLNPISPYYSVQAFFVISGFYMELLREQYFGSTAIFYTNRYSRLIVSYGVVVSSTLALAAVWPGNPFPFISYSPDSAAAAALLMVSNLTLFGMDIVQLVSPVLPDGLVVPQGWSLGAELWFYVLTPMFWRLSTKRIVHVLIASGLVRAILVLSPLPFFPWQQRFFPAELMFFLIGMLAYRVSPAICRMMPPGRIMLPFCVLSLCFFCSIVTDQRWWGSLLVGALMFVSIPSIFATSRKSKADRLLGEFSYPIYLWHVCIGYFASPLVAQWGSAFLIAASALASAPLVIFVERPLERWRQRRAMETKHVGAVA
jgi:peptidoglycan/LPS O-acetylase OafA/YrhL